MGLFERELETATMGRELERLVESGRVISVTGEAGSGKTSLVASVLASVLATGAQRVLRGLCDPLGTPRPLGPIRDVLDSLGEPRAGNSTPRSESAPAPDTAHALEGRFVDLVAAAPTVLVIEDAQWIDAASVEVLRFLVRRIDGLPVAFVLTYRDGDVRLGHTLLPLLGDIARSENATHLPLGPLSLAAVGAILGDAGLDPVRVHDLTGGNPFFVTEIARHPHEALPPTVRDAVLASTTGLGEADIETLQLIAAAPDAVDDALLTRIGVEPDALRRVESTGLLVHSRRGVAFHHELARLAVVEYTPPGVGRRLHLRILEGLESTASADHAVLTHHAVHAGDRERILRYARLAADEATRAGSHSEAGAFLTLALEQLVDGSAERAGLLEMLSTEQYMVSRLAEARGSARAALRIRERLGDADGIAAAHERRAIIEYYSARRDDAEEQADLAAHAAASAAASAAAEATRAYLAYRRQDLDTARRISEQALRLAGAATGEQTDAARRRLAITEAASDLVEGRTSSRLSLLLHASTAIQDSFDEIGTTAYSNLSALDIEHRRLAEAETVLAQSIPVTVARDIPICYQWQTGMRARLHLLRGRWTASAEDAATILEAHAAPLAVIWPHVISGLLALRQGGDPTTIDRHLAEAWEHARALDESPILLAVLAAYAERAWHTGERHPVLGNVDAQLARADETPGTSWAIGEVLVWLDRLGARATARQIAEPYRLELEGRHGEASEAWLELGVPFDSALAGVHSTDAETAAAALARLDQLGVEGTAARARAMLLARGVSGLPARPRRATRANPSGLTNRQLDVARLVAQGLTNGELAERLYISPKTADHHVSAVLAKLGLANRREIVRSASELGLA